MRRAKVAAREACGLAEGAHLESDAMGDIFLFGKAHAGGAEDAEAVGFIEQEHRIEGFDQVKHGCERADRAIHAED